MADIVVVGDAVTDVLVRLDSPPAPGSDVPAEITSRPGGQGAALGAWLVRAGVRAHLLSCLGADESGDRLEAALGAAGVCAHLERTAALPTGTIVVLVDGRGERTMLTDRGANRQGGAVGPGLLEETDHVHVSGYPLLDAASRAAAQGTLEGAHRLRKPVSVSTSSRAPLAAAGAEAFLAWTAGAELCLANHDEAEVLTGATDPGQAARSLLDHYPAVTVTGGASGAWFAGRDRDLVHLPAPPATVVDTTGAGDAFAAGFLAAWTRGAAPADAVRSGLTLARQAVSTTGSWPPPQ